jgi:hypothetical protein
MDHTAMASNGKWSTVPGKAINGFRNWLAGAVGVNFRCAKWMNLPKRPDDATVTAITLNRPGSRLHVTSALAGVALMEAASWSA